MTLRNWTTGLLLALLAAGSADAAAPLPEARLRLSAEDARVLLQPEPFSQDPPTRLKTSLNERFQSSATVQLNMVVILAEFTDNRANKTVNTIEHFDSLLFSRGLHPTGSMADYYYENSNGRLILNGQIRGWYTMPQTYDYYVSFQAGRGLYPRNVQGFVEDAVLAADAHVNYALFDNNGPDGVPDTIDDDQRIDLVMVIHAGPGGESTGRSNLQSLAWQLMNPIGVDGVFADEFCVSPELASLGVYAHETGHLLGLPDLYDATGGSFGLGTWTLMSGGWSLDEARTPAHLDAWCKLQLGFVTPTYVFQTLDDVVIDPVETGGKIYRLGLNGSPTGSEYFLVENRQKIGFDRFLPGEGLLVYHVDDLAPTNNIPTRYRVAIEQADGLFQLENFFDDPSFGDAGDPYTATTPSGGFGRYSVPDSRNHAGNETGVSVYNIRGPDASDKMTANLRAIPGPILRVERIEHAVTAGDEDAFVEPGESVEIRPVLRVEGTVHDVTVEVTSDDPFLTPGPGTYHIGDLGPGMHTLALPGGVGSGVPRDPYKLPLSIRITYREEVPVREAFAIPTGTVQGLANDFENGFSGFTHHGFRANRFDPWRSELSGGNNGPGAWHCGRADNGGFLAGTDAVLESPFFLVPPNAIFRMDHLVDIPEASGSVVAGALVEISVNGRPWTQITPTRGYDIRFFSSNMDLNNREIFTGAPVSPELPQWEGLTFDLSGFQGGAVLRFRFFSTATMATSLGWWIDNLRVESVDTPVWLASFSAVRTGPEVRLKWSLAGEDELAGLFVSRSLRGAGAFIRLNETLLPAGALEFVDGEPPAEAVVYRLEAVHRDGTILRLGTIDLESASAPVRPVLSAWPNPARGPVAFGFNLAAPGRVRFVVIDAAGRFVRNLLDGDMEAGSHEISWDATDDAGWPVPSGVYFYRLERDGSVQSRKLVVWR